MALPLPPGAPALLRPPTTIGGVLTAVNQATLLTADATIITRLFQGPRWGLFKGGKAVAAADSVVSVEYRQDTKIADYPIEQGSFKSYNKTGSPYDARVQLSKGGAEAERTAFLEAIEKATASLDLYDVVMPERVYRNANIQRFDYRRTSAAGVGLLTVELWLVEVRETIKTEFAATRAAPGAAMQSIGQRAPQPSPPGVRLPAGGG